MISRGTDGFFHPASEDELRALILEARSSGRKLRVRGAGHSEPGAYQADAGDIEVLLDRMIDVQFDDASLCVTVQAGCHLGVDPEDPSGTSTWENSLFAQLDARGWALADMEGITRQTVAGFLSTGSAGGSLEHSPADLVVTIRLIDGTGQVREYSRSDDENDAFYAAGVSMGLLGVVTAVTLQCVQRYTVEGQEATTGYDECEIDLFGDGRGSKPGLATFFRTTEHSRLLWWPQKGVHKITAWKAKKAGLADTLAPKPYRQVRSVLGATWPVYLAINLAFRLLDGLNPPAPRGFLARRFEAALRQLYKLIAGPLLKPSRQEFHDLWWRVLPMDDETNYSLLPTAFTELWLPLSQAEEVMQRLRHHYDQGGFPATGIYACELYASPSSKFWLSPAYDRESLKVDLFWPKNSEIDPHRHFYPQFWLLFRDMDYRLHWGKALAGDAEYLRAQYPRWEDFMRLRAQMDPDQVFVTEYWQRGLAIARL